VDLQWDTVSFGKRSASLVVNYIQCHCQDWVKKTGGAVGYG